jgi:inner membrane protein
MDPITHGVLGATLAQCGFHRKLGKKALIYGALSSMMPDIDVISEFIEGPIAGFKYHRWITHSLWFGPILGIIIGFLAWAYYRRQHSLLQWISLFSFTLLAHPLLDLFTSYGTQLFSPFSDQRCAFDVVSIID